MNESHGGEGVVRKDTIEMQCGKSYSRIRMEGAGSREKKPAQSGWAQEARWRRWPRPTLKVQEGDRAEGGSDFTPKEQQGKRPRVRRAGSRRAQDELGGSLFISMKGSLMGYRCWGWGQEWRR